MEQSHACAHCHSVYCLWLYCYCVLTVAVLLVHTTKGANMGPFIESDCTWHIQAIACKLHRGACAIADVGVPSQYLEG